MRLQIPIRAGIAASVLAHAGLVVALLLLAEVRPFAEVPEQRIEVDVVTAEDAPPPPELKPQPPLPEPQTSVEVAEQPPAPAKPEPAAPTQAQAQPQAQPQADSPPRKPEPHTPAPPQAEAAAPQTPAPQAPAADPATAYPPAIPQEPDLTVKYSVALGLPADGGGFDAPAETVADITAESAAALRKRLKSCAALPAGLSPTDNVRIVLRVALSPDGRLAHEPVLIEGSASAKGPALMQGAIDALAACQPYAMLPADKYKEWKVLDLGFTPQDFRGG